MARTVTREERERMRYQAPEIREPSERRRQRKRKSKLMMFGDVPTLLLALALSLLGILLIFTSGYAQSLRAAGNTIPREVIQQSLMLVIALPIYLFVAARSTQFWRKTAVGIMVLTLAALAAVLFAPIGTDVNESRRWLDFGFFRVQPSEFAKASAIIFLAVTLIFRKPWIGPRKPPRGTADWIDKVGVPKLKRMWPGFVVLAAIVLTELQPDLGTAVVITVIALTVFWVAGVSSKTIGILVASAVVAATLFAFAQPYRVARLLNHTDRWSQQNIDDIGFQTVHSEIAMASGSIFGVGIGSGRAKHILPASTTDFILTTAAEELGLVGMLLIIALTLCLCLRLIYLGLNSPSRFGMTVALGVAMWVAFQACLNVGVANGTLPPIGKPYPFLSAGGSSLLALWIGLGMAMSALRSPVNLEQSNVPDRNRRWDRGSRVSGDRSRTNRTRTWA